ncbi:DNA directed RNA polymerase subunit D [uncultured Mediterranean phage]|nr:DNA directed RNA polymerase subunit D [uncultured Mediterranean phage]
MNPQISEMYEDRGVLKFTLSGVHMSLANSIRRTILSDIPTVVFRTFPYNENQATIHKNTTRFNNEILKQRLSCIPIHIQDLETPLEDFEVEINMKNKTDSIQFITSKDFRVKNIKLDSYINTDEVRKIFPADSITGEYIDFARLRPKISDEIPGEELHITAKLSIGTADQDGMFNVVSTCAYANTIDPIKRDDEWKKYLTSIAKERSIDKDEQEAEKENWMLLEGKRQFKPNSFDFTVETIGVYENKVLIAKAVKIIMNSLVDIFTKISNGDFKLEESDSTLKNGYDVKLEGYDYTVGKVIEFMLYDMYYRKEETLSYISFKKIHPHDSYGLLRFAFREPTDSGKILFLLQTAFEASRTYYEEILASFEKK